MALHDTSSGPATSGANSLPGDVPTREGYDRWAAVYDDDGNPLVALEERELAALLGDVRGRVALDVGCGTGRHALRLAAAGADVTAIDFSTGMLDRARRKPFADCVRFMQHDLHQPLPFAAESFDLVLCGLVVDHIGDLVGLFREMGRVCRADGRVVITVMHPALLLKGVQARFTDPATGQKVRVDSRSHSLSDYVRAAVQAGLRMEHLSEHSGDAALVAIRPRAEPYLGWPLLFVMVCRPG